MLDGGAKDKVKSLTARHLALSANCVLLIRDYFIPNFRINFIDHPSNPNGFNIRKLIDKEFTELIQNLDSHADSIIAKFSNIIVEAVQPAITSAASAIVWDATIEKNVVISTSAYIDQILQTLFSMTKILFQVLCLT